MAQEVKLDAAGAVAEVVLESAEANALDRQGIQDLQGALLDLRQSDTLRAIILTGANGTFCGGRIRDRSLITAEEIETDLAPIIELNRVFDSYPVPVIAAVEGQALGFGFGLAMLSDFAIAGQSAKFALTELAHGIPPLIVLAYLFNLVPYKVAFNMALTGEELSAGDAAHLGLLTEVVADGGSLARAHEVAALVVGTDPTAISLLREYSRKNAALIDDHAATTGAGRIAALLAANTPH
jgi:enoyl-CoA hydratase/carnithine racemase